MRGLDGEVRSGEVSVGVWVCVSVSVSVWWGQCVGWSEVSTEDWMR